MGRTGPLDSVASGAGSKVAVVIGRDPRPCGAARRRAAPRAPLRRAKMGDALGTALTHQRRGRVRASAPGGWAISCRRELLGRPRRRAGWEAPRPQRVVEAPEREGVEQTRDAAARGSAAGALRQPLARGNLAAVVVELARAELVRVAVHDHRTAAVPYRAHPALEDPAGKYPEVPAAGDRHPQARDRPDRHRHLEDLAAAR